MPPIKAALTHIAQTLAPHRGRLRIIAVCAAIALVFCIEWPIPAAAGLAERFGLRIGADACTVKGIRASLTGGLSVDGLSVTLPVDGQLRLAADLPSLHFRYKPLYTLTHWSELMDALMAADTVEGSRRSPAKKARTRTPALKQTLERLAPFGRCVGGLSFRGGRLALKGFGPWTVTILRPDVRLDLNLKDGIRIKGEARAASAGIDDIVFQKPSLRIGSVDSLLQITRMRGRFFDGRAEGKLGFDLATMKITGGAIDIRRVDVERLYRAAAVGGSLRGHADARLLIDTSGLSWPAIRGHLDLSLRDIIAKDFPVVENLFILGELSGLSFMRFSAIEIAGTLAKGWVEVDTVYGKGVPLSVEASGRVRPADGYFRFGVRGVFIPSYQDSVSPLVWDAMTPEPEGRKSVKGVLSGTFTSPSLSIDRTITRRAVRNVFGGGGGGVRSIFD